MDLRLPADEKNAIERAASSLGVSVSAFVRNAAREAALERLEQAQTVTLDATASRAFLDSLEQPFTPNKALAKAMRRAEGLGL